jgi:glyoxylase-like metal-dependent hydrolase (beta-lactamase superfamily II)
MKVTIIPVTPFQQNCSLLLCEQTKQAAVVDPGGDLELILDELKRQGAQLEKILLTHGHIDHCGGTAQLAAELGVPVEGPHSDDRFLIDDLPLQGLRFGFPQLQSFTPARWLAGGDRVRFGREELQVRHCPGHTPGHVIFFSAEHRLALVGDVLFAGSIGRTDLPRGDHATLIRSIREQLWPLGEDVSFIPGHGPTSTFGDERAGNPFVGDRALRA